MLKSIEAIWSLKSGNKSVLKKETWLKYLALTNEKHVSIERVSSVDEIKTNSVLNYVEKTLIRLDNTTDLTDKEKFIVEEVLKWSEVAKGGMQHKREEWEKNGINLFVHNVGSSQIYMQDSKESDIDTIITKYIINNLIATHGLIGQYLRGEVNLSENKLITNLINMKYIEKSSLKNILVTLNYCIIDSVSTKIWNEVMNDVIEAIDNVIEGNYTKEKSLKERVTRLRLAAINKGENIDKEFEKYFSNDEVSSIFNHLFNNAYLWHVEGALSEFNFEEFVKVFLLVYKNSNPLSINHISFETLMQDLYYDYQGHKAVNLFKKRIIEKYLSEIAIDNIMNSTIEKSEHVNYAITKRGLLDNTVSISFEFSNAGAKLIEFCQEAEKSSMYGKATLLLYDLFGFRKDQYDRFNNEGKYLEDMNGSVGFKAVIPDYFVGDTFIDVGPGGGALMDIMLEKHPNAQVLGVDISTNVVEELTKKKHKEGKAWDVIQADVVKIDEYVDNIKDYFKGKKVSSIAFSSIIHEIFSYNTLDGKKFNYDSIKLALQNSYDMLEVGGRIIIRDGIMTEDTEAKRIIKFKDKEDMVWFYRYVNEFQGRELEYEVIDECTVKMLINDAMEFLYTYTWGADAFDLEIHEQFGYFTPNGYKQFIKETLGEGASIVECKHYLQEGYEEHLLEKIEFFNEDLKTTCLPDSTSLIVIEKAY